MTHPTNSSHLGSAPEKLVKLSDVEAMINRKIDKLGKTSMVSDTSRWGIGYLRNLLSSLSSLPTQNVPEIDNFYEFSESGNVWFKGRLARYTYLSRNGGMMNARYIRNLPPTN